MADENLRRDLGTDVVPFPEKRKLTPKEQMILENAEMPRSPDGKAKPTRTIRVDPELWAMAKRVAGKRGETISWAITKFLLSYVGIRAVNIRMSKNKDGSN